MEQAIIVFTKNPVLGSVKTRLAATIGDEKALKVFRFLLAHTKSIIKPLIASTDLILFHKQFVDENDVWSELHPIRMIQTGKDLGERMNNAFESVFSMGYKKVLIIGTDIYEQTSDRIEQAFKQLDQYDVVVNPAKDGGYCLMGMKKNYPALFLNKTWSHSDVFKELENEIKQLELSVYSFSPINDIDTIEDYRASGIESEIKLGVK